MADTFSIGLPNQGLKDLSNPGTLKVLETIPLEADVAVVLAGAAETDLLASSAIPAGYKATIDSVFVTAANVDNIFRLYRNGVCVLTYTTNVTAQSEQVLPVGGGKEFDEGETLRATVQSTVGVGTVKISISGRAELKRNELYSQILA